jgi:hypothetical protein
MIGRSTVRQIRRQIFLGRCTDEQTIDDTNKMTDRGKTSSYQTDDNRKKDVQEERKTVRWTTDVFCCFFSQRNSDCGTKSKT